MALGPGGGRQSKKQVDEMLEFIYEPTTESVDQSKVDSGPPSADTLAPLVRVIAKAADMRKADDIVAMRIAKLSTVAGFIVICCGNSRPQNQAIAAAIKDDVAEEFDGEHSLLGNGVPEGNADSGWILLDYGDIMVHIMTPKSRLFYDIEGQWREKGGEYMDLSDVLLSDSKTSSQTGGSGTMEGISEEDDPFWS
jgi:ribosome-associated protein